MSPSGLFSLVGAAEGDGDAAVDDGDAVEDDVEDAPEATRGPDDPPEEQPATSRAASAAGTKSNARDRVMPGA
jgi:hypothetical protein